MLRIESSMPIFEYSMSSNTCESSEYLHTLCAFKSSTADIDSEPYFSISASQSAEFRVTFSRA